MKAWNHANASEVVNTTRENHKYIQIQSNLIKYRTLPAIFGLSQLWSRPISLCQQEQPRNTAFCIVWLDAVSYCLNFVGRYDLTSWVFHLLLIIFSFVIADEKNMERAKTYFLLASLVGSWLMANNWAKVFNSFLGCDIFMWLTGVTPEGYCYILLPWNNLWLGTFKCVATGPESLFHCIIAFQQVLYYLVVHPHACLLQ